jgi:aldehyde dehydrogenase (NAD+)
VVAVASQPFPLAATDFVQVLETSDVPPGVANILTGDHAELALHLAGHMDVDAVWSFSGAGTSATVERESAGNLKRTWVDHGRARDWTRADAPAFLRAATEVQTVWVPYGE